MQICSVCGSKFKDTDALLNHIAEKHGPDNNSLVEITPELCTELGVTESQMDVIKDTVAKGATDQELLYFLNACRAYDLNPITKEIYYTKAGGKVVIMVSRDGMLKLAHRNPNFMGIHSGVVCEKDTFTLVTESGDGGTLMQTIKHVIPSFGKRGDILGAWCRIDMRDQAPIIHTVDWNDYNKNNQVWKTYGAALITKCAESVALKRVGEAPGLVSAAEMMDGRCPTGVIDAEIVDMVE